MLVIATGSRRFCRPSTACATDDGTLKDGAFVFRTIDDCDRMLRGRQQARARGGHRRRAARHRSGARPAQPRARRAHRPPDAARHGRAARSAGGRHSAAAARADGARSADRARATTARSRGRTRDRRPVRGRLDARLRHGRRRGRHPSERPARQAAGLPVNRGILVGDDLACPGADGRLRDRRVRRAPRPALWSGRAALGAGARPGRPADRPQRRRRSTPARGCPRS